jgi:hypothetical protein
MKFVTTALLACTALVLAVSCSKKDKDSLSIKKIGGDYIMYEVEFPDTTYKMPLADGGHGKFVLNLLNDSTCTNQIMLINEDDIVEADTTWNCRVTKDPDGDIVLYDNKGLIAYIYEGYEMDFYALQGMRFGAKKK